MKRIFLLLGFLLLGLPPCLEAAEQIGFKQNDGAIRNSGRETFPAIAYERLWSMEINVMGGVAGEYGLASLDGRLDFEMSDFLAVSGKGTLYGQSPYDFYPNLHYRRIRWKPWDLSSDLKLGARLTAAHFTLSGFYGNHTFRGEKAGESWEGEVIINLNSYALEQVGRWYPVRENIWSRSRFNWHYVVAESERLSLGFEYFFEGHDKLERQEYHYSRQQVFWQYQASNAAGGNWWSILIGAGPGAYGWGGEIELTTGIK